MSWGKAKLGEVCTIEKGNIGIMKAISGEFPLVVLGAERRTHNEYQFDDEAVIIPLVSSTGHGHRSMKRIFYQTRKFSIGSILCAVIPKDKSKLSAEFLYRYLDFNKENELVARMKGMANVSLPMKEIASVEIPLPPIEHQKKLIEEFQKLETSNNQISTELSHQLELVRQLRQAFLREAMQGKLVPQDTADEPAEILLDKIKAEKEKLVAEKKIKKDKPMPEIKPGEISFEIPNNWTWCRLGEIFKFIDYRGKTPNKSQSGMRLITAKNIRMGYIDEHPVEYMTETDYEKWMVRGFPKIGDLLFVTEGHTMGFVAQIDKKYTFALAQRTMTFQPFNYDYVKFIYYFILCPMFQKTIKANATGSAAMGMQSAKLKLIPVPLPPLAEQKRIVEKLEKLMKYCDQLEANIRESKANAESLLQVALKEALEPK